MTTAFNEQAYKEHNTLKEQQRMQIVQLEAAERV